jgi:queuine tRNA-ribosyltransferase
MAWPRAILTDSGGYQVFSLSELRKVTDEGVRFRSHLDGSEHLLTPEKAAEVQLALGSDIAMVLDECIETPAPRDAAESALRRTTQWARRARNYFLDCVSRNGNLAQWQFGIVQGATFADLRRESARQLLQLDFPGYAVGGLAVGEPHAMTCEMTGEVTALLPAERPRYLMGVGRPEQLADYIALGIDMMDCVLPTRAARHACLYTKAACSSRMRATRKTSGPLTRRVPARYAGATLARICGTFLRRGKSPRPFWPPTTMSTFTLTSCGKSARLSGLGT